jgi:hypothetical protein
LAFGADNRSTRIEFDQPPSVFGQFDKLAATVAAQSQDAKNGKPSSQNVKNRY